MSSNSKKAKEIFIELDGSQKWQLDKKFNITANTKNYLEYKNKLIDIISYNLDCFELLTYSYNINFNKLKINLMNIKLIDRILSTFFLSALFLIGLSFYFVIVDYKILNLHNDIIFTYIVMPVIFFIYWLLGRLKLNILDDICELF